MSEAPKQVQVTGLSKWELALYVGAPVAAVCLAGLAYQYLNKNSVAVENAKDDQETDAVKSDKAEELVEDVKEKVRRRQLPKQLSIIKFQLESSIYLCTKQIFKLIFSHFSDFKLRIILKENKPHLHMVANK